MKIGNCGVNNFYAYNWGVKEKTTYIQKGYNHRACTVLYEPECKASSPHPQPHRKVGGRLIMRSHAISLQTLANKAWYTVRKVRHMYYFFVLYPPL